MARGDCQRAFAEAATADGLELVGQSFPWLNQRGHLGLPSEASIPAATLETIYVTLGGDLAALASAPPTRITGDFLHAPSGTLIEIDEAQHFTTARLTTLDQ